MAAYIPVPRDLTRVKTKVFFNLTKRQLLCFGAAALIGVPIFFLVKATGNVSLAALSMMIVMLPLFFLAMYEKDGTYIIWIAEKPVRVIGKPVFDLIDGDICMRKHTDSCTVFERHSIR